MVALGVIPFTVRGHHANDRSCPKKDPTPSFFSWKLPNKKVFPIWTPDFYIYLDTLLSISCSGYYLFSYVRVFVYLSLREVNLIRSPLCPRPPSITTRHNSLTHLLSQELVTTSVPFLTLIWRTLTATCSTTLNHTKKHILS